MKHFCSEKEKKSQIKDTREKENGKWGCTEIISIARVFQKVPANWKKNRIINERQGKQKEYLQ